MSLNHNRGPLGAHPAGWASPRLPGPVSYVEPHPRRVQAVSEGQVVLDTERVLLVHRPGCTLTYAFPREVVRDLPTEPEPLADGYVRVPWDAVDEWREEGRVLRHYPPNPYHRVDCRPSRRRLRVEVAGTVLVDTDDTVVLFETAMPARLYVSPVHVRTDLLRRTATSTYCNYKGDATYWSVVLAADVVEDAAWSYEHPLPESLQIGGFLSFDPAKVDVEAELPGG
jgi:uncharacterized protein (DUF427 family)